MSADKAPTLSIVIPCFNAEQTLRATIESALRQDVDKEIIIIDDGSTDGSADIIRSFGTAVRPSFGANAGAGAARNAGTRLARGAYLQYLDSDDLLADGTLRARLEALQSSGADVAHTDWQELVEDAGGRLQPGDVRCPPLYLIATDSEVATATSRFWAPPAALLYRRAIVTAVGRWREDLKIIQDARFLFDAAASGAHFAHVPGVGAFYRVAANSLSRRNPGHFVEECIRNAAEVEERWCLHQVPTKLRKEALREMWKHAAFLAAIRGLDGFNVARAGCIRTGPRDYAIEGAWLARCCLGTHASAKVLQSAFFVKAWARHKRHWVDRRPHFAATPNKSVHVGE